MPLIMHAARHHRLWRLDRCHPYTQHEGIPFSLVTHLFIQVPAYLRRELSN